LQWQQSSGGTDLCPWWRLRGWDTNWSLESNESRIPPQSHTETQGWSTALKKLCRDHVF
jgi:hypothetical protein